MNPLRVERGFIGTQNVGKKDTIITKKAARIIRAERVYNKKIGQ